MNGGLLEALRQLSRRLLADFDGLLAAIEQSSAGRLAAFSRPSGDLRAASWRPAAASDALSAAASGGIR